MVGLAGCFGMGGNGTLAFYVKDAPSDDYEEVWVRFTEVQVHESSGGGANDTEGDAQFLGHDGNETTGNETGDNQTDGNETFPDLPAPEGPEEEGWITVFESPDGVAIDLKSYTGTDRAFLGDSDVDPGTYTQIRVTVAEAWGVTPEGDLVEFTVPSDELKVVQPFEITANQTTAITLDFDLDQSIQPAGASGQVIFKPVLGEVIVEEDAPEPTGTTGAASPMAPADNETAPTQNQTAPPANQTWP